MLVTAKLDGILNSLALLESQSKATESRHRQQDDERIVMARSLNQVLTEMERRCETRIGRIHDMTNEASLRDLSQCDLKLMAVSNIQAVDYEECERELVNRVG